MNCSSQFLILMMLSVVLTGCIQAPTALEFEEKPLDGVSQADGDEVVEELPSIAEGKRLYSTRGCMSCHGVDIETSAKRGMSLDRIKWSLSSNNVPEMSMIKLDERQMVSLVMALSEPDKSSGGATGETTGSTTGGTTGATTGGTTGSTTGGTTGSTTGGTTGSTTGGTTGATTGGTTGSTTGGTTGSTTGGTTGSTTGGSTAPLNSQQAFEKYLYPITRTNCISCHTSQVPRHASADAVAAHNASLAIVSFPTPTSSKVIGMMNSRHNCGTAANCNNLGNQFLTAIQNWKKAREVGTTTGGTTTGGTTTGGTTTGGTTTGGTTTGGTTTGGTTTGGTTTGGTTTGGTTTGGTTTGGTTTGGTTTGGTTTGGMTTGGSTTGGTTTGGMTTGGSTTGSTTTGGTTGGDQPPSVLEGQQLYRTKNCLSCHGQPIESSTKFGVTLDRLKWSLNPSNVPAMSTVKLSQREMESIVLALNYDSGKTEKEPLDRTGRMMGRKFVTSVLTEVFTTDKLVDKDFVRKLRGIWWSPAIFGTPCNVYNSELGADCDGEPLTNTAAPIHSLSSVVRQLDQLAACEQLTASTSLMAAIVNAGGVDQSGKVIKLTDSGIVKIYELFNPDTPISEEQKKHMTDLLKKISTAGRGNTEEWRMFIQLNCEQPGWTIN